MVGIDGEGPVVDLEIFLNACVKHAVVCTRAVELLTQNDFIHT